MTTVADYKAVITTEICIPLCKLSEGGIGKVIGKNGCYLKLVEDTSNTSIQWDNKTQNIYIHGQPRAAKKAHTIITTQMSKLASPKVIMTPRIPKPAGPKFIATPQTMVNLNLLGKDFTDGVHFCKLTDETTSSDDGNGSQGDRDSTNSGAKRKPASFVVHPITMTEEEKQRGRIMARDLWRNADFVGWDFKENVIRDASMVLRRQIMELPQGQGKYLKLEIGIGKVIFHENNHKNYPLQNAKFAISEFRHLRFNNEITSVFRREWNKSWIAHLRHVLPTLGYDKDGNIVKTVKIYHNAQRDDGKFYNHIWSADILEGKRLGDSKSGTLEFVKARVYESSPFSATIYGPATSFDLRFSVVRNARESARNKQKIEDRIRRAYRYSSKRGLMVNHSFENSNGYTPLVHPKARHIRETTWIRGHIKVIILEVQDGSNSKFQVKVRSGLLKKYTRNDPGEVQLENIFKAVKELFEAAEELNDELDVLGTELSPESFAKPTRPTENEMHSCPTTPTGTMNRNSPPYNPYQTPTLNRLPTPTINNPLRMDKFMATDSITVRREPNEASPSQVPVSRDKSEDNAANNPFDFVLGSAPKNTDFGPQPEKGSMSPALADSPTTGVRGTEVFWEGRLVGIIDEFGFGTPVLTPTRTAPAIRPSPESSPKGVEILPKNDKVKVNKPKLELTNHRNSNSSVTPKWLNHNTVPIPAPRDNSVPPHLRPVTKSPKMFAQSGTPPGSSSPTRQVNPPHNNLSDYFFNLLDSPADQSSSSRASILTPNKIISPKSGRMRVDFFGSVEPLKGDDGDLMSWSPNKNELAYVHENDSLELEMGEGVSLLLD